ncbi:CAP domain-containing protein [Tissierella sp. MB52-C2]|uniref:CAP domain-containing protein n=1 Tax=Tissierella sp. MB52-C2 TaxID=3070999 RepID=UPI00280C165B|nr:CAP domain-containing protein [Tissierella sp. MB52-C2]WMM25322.1 CAP domain-containing protein [Tissierella sp. MB52-C2]
MFTRKRKVVYSLIAATIFSSSAASAASFDLTNFDYNSILNNYSKEYSINSNYDCNKNSNTQQNTTVKGYPNYNWTIITNRPGSKPGNVVTIPNTNKPTKPTYPTKPSNPDPTTPTTPTEPTTPTNPKPTTPPTTETPSVSGLSAIEAEVVRLVNIERQKEGLKPFVASSELSKVARTKSEDMATKNYFSHTSPTYGSPFDMMKSFGIKYNTAGENIAKGQLTAQSVVNGWMNSSGHRANIMNPSFNKIGVGLAKSSNGTNYWTQMFTN